MSNRRLTSTPDAKAARDQLAEAGAAGMTTTIGTIQQRLPTPRRRKPSLPAVTLEGVKRNRSPANGLNGAAVTMTDDQALEAFSYASLVEPAIKAEVAAAKARIKAQARPKPVEIPERRDMAEVQTTYVGAGRDRTKEPERRALTHCERQHLNGTLTFEEMQVATSLRNRFLAELGHSEGVASYGDPNASGPAWQKADRRAQTILRRNRSNRTMLADLLYSMVGVTDTEGRRGFDQQLAVVLVRAAVETVDNITAGAIGAMRMPFEGTKQRQASGSAILKESLRRGAAHMGLVRLPDWRDATSWRVLDYGAK